MATYDEIFANDSNILIVRPRLAVAIGLHEAIIINQVEYWINHYKTGKKKERDEHTFDGEIWIYNTMSDWHEQFPFITEDLIQRKLSRLKKMGVLIATSKFNKVNFDKTLWYRINYARLMEIIEESERKSSEMSISVDGNENDGTQNTTESRKNVENSHIGKIPTSMTEKPRHGTRENPDTNTIDYTETTKQRNLKAVGSLSKDRTVNFDVSLGKSLQNMRKVVSDDKEYETMEYLTEYFYSILYSRTREVHHVLSRPQCQKIYDALTDTYEPISAYRDEAVWQIHRYVHDFIDKAEMTMEHFATSGILEIGDYELAHKSLVDEDVDYRMYYILQHPNCLMKREEEPLILASAT